MLRPEPQHSFSSRRPSSWIRRSRKPCHGAGAHLLRSPQPSLRLPLLTISTASRALPPERGQSSLKPPVNQYFLGSAIAASPIIRGALFDEEQQVGSKAMRSQCPTPTRDAIFLLAYHSSRSSEVRDSGIALELNCCSSPNSATIFIGLAPITEPRKCRFTEDFR